MDTWSAARCFRLQPGPHRYCHSGLSIIHTTQTLHRASSWFRSRSEFTVNDWTCRWPEVFLVGAGLISCNTTYAGSSKMSSKFWITEKSRAARSRCCRRTKIQHAAAFCLQREYFYYVSTSISTTTAMRDGKVERHRLKVQIICQWQSCRIWQEGTVLSLCQISFKMTVRWEGNNRSLSQTSAPNRTETKQ